MVVDNHPTLLNITLHPSKVGVTKNNQVHLWQPPWLGIIKHHEQVIEITREGERGDWAPFFGLISKANDLLVFSLERYCLVVILMVTFIR